MCNGTHFTTENIAASSGLKLRTARSASQCLNYLVTRAPMACDSKVRAHSTDPDQTAPLRGSRVYTVCNFICIMHYHIYLDIRWGFLSLQITKSVLCNFAII